LAHGIMLAGRLASSRLGMQPPPTAIMTGPVCISAGLFLVSPSARHTEPPAVAVEPSSCPARFAKAASFDPRHGAARRGAGVPSRRRATSRPVTSHRVCRSTMRWYAPPDPWRRKSAIGRHGLCLAPLQRLHARGPCFFVVTSAKSALATVGKIVRTVDLLGQR
jgi:hypothetical protein